MGDDTWQAFLLFAVCLPLVAIASLIGAGALVVFDVEGWVDRFLD